jgi:hypothetical protein
VSGASPLSAVALSAESDAVDVHEIKSTLYPRMQLFHRVRCTIALSIVA